MTDRVSHPVPATRKLVIVAISLFVAFLHFIVGPSYQGPFREFVGSYLIDILLPTALYLLLLLASLRWFRLTPGRWLSAVAVMLIGSGVEILQYMGVAVLGETFDPLDFLMYAAGTFLGFLTGLLLFNKSRQKDVP